MWKSLKKEFKLVIDAKAYFFFILYAILFLYYIYKNQNDRALLYMLAFMNPLIISANFFYMGKHDLHYKEKTLKYDIGARYVYYILITVVEYGFGVVCSTIGMHQAQNADITLVEGFYIAIIMSMTLGAFLLPYMFAKKEEDVMPKVIRIYVILVVGLILVLAIFYALSTLINDFSINGNTISMMNNIGFIITIIAMIAFCCSYVLSFKLCMKRASFHQLEDGKNASI